MNSKNIKKWIAALRSGEYKQGQGVLRDDRNRYCCLGVACEIAGIEFDVDADLPPPALAGWLGLPVEDRHRDTLVAFRAATRASVTIVPTTSTRSEVSAKWPDAVAVGSTLVAPGEVYLAALNDEGATFEEIADLIEKHIDHLHVRA